jgi:penicillin-binding protein 1A
MSTIFGIKKSEFWPVFKKFQLFNLGFFLLVIFVFILARLGLFGYIPKFDEIKNPKSVLATNIYSSDYELLGSYYIQNRTEVSYDELSPWLVKGLIATEDKRYYDHCGIDARGLFRAFIKPFLLGKNAGGGSTITQQTAKNLYYPESVSSRISRLFKKPKEWLIAIQLERNFSKEEIVAIYFNSIPYNYNAYGIKSACHTYFNKQPNELTLEEAALLVGMLKGPSYYNPRLHPDRCKTRRNTVLGLMSDAGFITSTQRDSAMKTDIKLDYHSSRNDAGLATYFRDQLTIDLKAWIEKHPKADGSKYNLYTDGLQIYTSIDSKMQTYAEEAVTEQLKSLQALFFKEWRGKDPWKSGQRANPDLLMKTLKRTDFYKELKEKGLSDRQIERELNLRRPMTIFTYNGERDTLFSMVDSVRYYKQLLSSGFVVLDPQSGLVKAWVGGPNFTYFQLDHVRATKRQVGSTIKPLLYALAIENGMSPSSTVPYTCPGIAGHEAWCPDGTGHWEEGTEVPISEGLKYSDNKVTAQLIKKFGAAALIKMARRLQITADMENAPAICLGTSDISVMEMAGAYTAFANKGIYTKPTYLVRIEDKDGHILDEFFPQREHALSEGTAYTTAMMMRGVVTGGTAARLSRYGLRVFVAGKTGTTQSNSDAWFIGFTPELLGAVWVGADDPSIHFASTNLGQGAAAALPIWGSFFRKVYNDRSIKLNRTAGFGAPEGYVPDSGATAPVDTNSVKPVTQQYD